MYNHDIQRLLEYHANMKRFATRKETILLMIQIHDFHKSQAIDNALINNDRAAFNKLTGLGE